jgi:2,3-bisphosphoglycerate-dependent phosphoglycerate mutase
MSISIWVGNKRFEVGTASFLKAFFSTIYLRLEEGRWGSLFPVLMDEFYSGSLSAARCPAALAELGKVRNRLAEMPPSQVVWDFEDRTRQPPWGNNISKDITSLANYFVTSDGKDLITVLSEVFKEGAKANREVSIG